MFDENHFPYQYECSGCDTTATVTHENVQDVPSYLTTSSVAEAVEYVMTNRRGWTIQPMDDSLCPKCADTASDLS